MITKNASLLGLIAAAVVAAIFFASRNKNGSNGTGSPAVNVPEPTTPQVLTDEQGQVVRPKTPGSIPELIGDPIGSFGSDDSGLAFNGGIAGGIPDPVTPDFNEQSFSDLPNSLQSQRILKHITTSDEYIDELDVSGDGKLNSFDAAYALQGRHR